MIARLARECSDAHGIARGLGAGWLGGTGTLACVRRLLVEAGAGLRLSKEVRDLLIVGPQNVRMEPPFPGLDVLSCRNPVHAGAKQDVDPR